MADALPGSGVNPPGLGEALDAGWNAFKRNAGVFIGATFLISISGLIPFLPLLLMPGFYLMSLKAVRGQAAEFNDLFLMFQDRFVDHLMLMLLQISGALLCGIGQLVTTPLFIPGSFLVVDRNMAWKPAMDECMNRVKPTLLNWVIFVIVLFLIAGLGSLACFVGFLVTMPVAMCGIAFGYEKSLAAKPV